jgi:hypothetical protein
MRIVLLLIVALAVAFAARQALRTNPPVAPPAPTAAGSQAPRGTPATAAGIKRFGQALNPCVVDSASERARKTDEATR